jgi:hypothetical protein
VRAFTKRNKALEQGRMTKNKPPKGRKMNHIETAFDPVAAALKQMHEAVTSEALPDDFLRILEEIDAKIDAATSTTHKIQ